MNISWWSAFIPNHILENGVLSKILQRRSFGARGRKNAASRSRLGVLVNSRESSFSCDSRNGFGKSDDVVLTMCNKGPAISVHPLLQQCKINIAGWCFMNARSLTMRIREGRSSYIWFTSFLRDGHCFFYLTTENLKVILTHDSPSVIYLSIPSHVHVSYIFAFH